MIFTIFHNEYCSKSKACIAILKQMNITFNIREYIKKPLSLKEVEDIVRKVEGDKTALLRNNNLIKLNTTDLINHIYKNQRDLQRPIFFNGEKYIICRPAVKVLDYID